MAEQGKVPAAMRPVFEEITAISDAAGPGHPRDGRRRQPGHSCRYVAHPVVLWQSFLVSYATRIGERLREAADRVHDPVEDERLLPVLAERSWVVEETFQEMFSDLVQRLAPVTNGAGWDAGRAAADRADITVGRQAVDA